MSSPILAGEQQPVLDFHIPAESLSQALLAYAHRTDVSILIPDELAQGRRSAALEGGATKADALRRLLAGSGLKFEFVDATSVRVYADAGESAAPAKGKAPPPPAPRIEASDVQEITVTARKKSEKLQDTPLSMSVLTGADLEEAAHIRIEDLNQLSPNNNTWIINGHQTSFSVRGLGNNPANDGLENSVGVFMDGVYLGRPGMAAMDLIDINQIEMLRGPQGTLFGKNTTAGAVNITTALPSFNYGAVGQVSFGNDNYQQYQAAITGPLIGDQLAGRLTVYETLRDGAINDTTLGQKVGGLDREGGRVQLLYAPSDDFSSRLIGEYAREQQSNGAVLVLNSLGATPAAIEQKLKATGGSIIVSPDGLTATADGQLQTGTRQYAISNEINWNLDGVKLTSITAYRRWQYRSDSDTDASSADVLNGGYDIHDSQWSEELRAALPTVANVDPVVGLYYFGQRLRMDQRTEYGSEAAAWLSGISDALLPAYAKASPTIAALLAYNNTHWNTWATPNTNSYAVFGQGVWHVTPDWNVTLGARETYEHKSELVWRTNPTSAATGAPVAALAYNTTQPVDVTVPNASPSFLVSSDYHLTPELMVYGSVSRGAKAGGANANLPATGLGADSLKVKAETATSYEMGAKGDWFDHHLQLDGNLFYTDVEDYQASYLSVVNGSAVSMLSNVGQVNTRGAELEGTLRPMTGLTLHGSVGYDLATYGSYTNAPCPVEVSGRSYCDLTGRSIMGAPKWTSGFDAAYEHPITEDLAGYVRGEYSWRSSYFGSIDDSRYSETGNFHTVNLYGGIRDTDRNWDVMLWAKNVLNEHNVVSYLNYGSLLPGAYVPFYASPISFGVTLRASM